MKDARRGACPRFHTQDFADRLLSSRTAPSIVWLRIGNTSNRALLTWLLPLWPDILSRIESGDKLIEVREKLSPNE